MPGTRIEITAENQEALAAYDQLIDAQDQQERAAQASASTSQQTARQTAAANEAAAQKGAASYNRIIRELRKQGPVGRAQAQAIEQHLRETGQAGRRSVEQITAELSEMDEHAAAAASAAGAAIEKEMTEAANASGPRLKKLTAELSKLGPEGRKQAAEIRRHLQRTGIDGTRSIGSIVDEIETIDNAAARVARNAGNSFDQAGEKGQQAFGANIRGELASMAATWLSVNAVVGTYTRLLERARDAARESVETLLDTTDGNQKLLQVAEDADDFEKLTDKADELASKYGIAREQARNLVFSARSEDFEDDLDFIARNAGNRVIDTQAQATVAGRAPALFQNEDLSGRETINATLVAAKQSNLDFEQIARVLPSVAASAAQTEATFDESVGALSVLAGQFKSGEQGADRIAALAARLNLDTGEDAETEQEFLARLKKRDGAKRRDGESVSQFESRLLEDAESAGIERRSGRESLADQGLVRAVRRLRDDFTEEQRRDFLGESKEVNEAFANFANRLEEIEARTDLVRQAREATGTDQSATAQRNAIAEQSLQISAVRNKIAAENAAEIEGERQLAIREAERQAKEARTIAEQRARGDSEVVIQGRAAVRSGVRKGEDTLDGFVELLGVNRLDSLASDAFDAQSDSAFADPQTQQRLEAITFGANALRRRQNEAGPGERARFTPSDVQTIYASLGETITPDQVTPSVQRELTNEFIELANDNGGRSGIYNQSLIAEFGGFNRARQQRFIDGLELPAVPTPIESGRTETRPDSQPSPLAETNALLRESIALQNEQLQASRDTANASQDTAAATNRTAENTLPRDSDPDAIIAAANEQRIPSPE
ncbi:MAG: hypothetical protein AAFX06_31405 [Planctomycetota bacterium]